MIIDSIENIEVDERKYVNETFALLHLRDGLIALYNQVHPVELEIKKACPSGKLTFFGYPSFLPQEYTNLLPCFFHWFGVTICNYARLVGYIMSKERGLLPKDKSEYNRERKLIKKACDNYIKSLTDLKDVLQWRNKVAAHFALTDPWKDDNIATLEASVICAVGFDDDRFRTQPFISHISGFDAEIPNWSLTEVFERLCPRFWPEVEFNK